MTSETEDVKTNEFLRRRKLRLQQVREQSKDIAKKIRQRAKVEKLRQVVELDSTKQKEYLECQDKLIKHLELIYARGLDNVGASHQSASELTQKDVVNKTDLSKLRGKEAAAALRKQKQEKLDQQKKLLDRKLHARETANEISRDKSTAIAQKFITKSTNTNKVSDDAQTAVSSTDLLNTKENNKDDKVNAEPESVKTNDMATQWDVEAIPPEWEPAVPALSLPTDKDSSPRGEDNEANKTEKRLDLFALSKEMPASLRGKYTHESRPRETNRPSLTLVSEYLQSRKLRLRENDTVNTNTNKKPSDDINSLKQTILHTRSSKPEGSHFNVCHVLDEQVIPVPSWRAEGSCQFCFHSTNYHATPVPSRQFQNVTNSQINQIFSSIRPVRPQLLPSPVLRSTSPFRRSKVSQKISKGQTSTFEKQKPSQDTPLNRKPSVTMYNHSTRDTRDLPCGDNKLVVRDKQSEEDAYSQAMKEVSATPAKTKDHQRKVQDMRSKVAVTKQNVEKEYKDTMNFLNALPKKSDKVIKTAYMDARRQQMQQDNRQQKMQDEYKKIEKECKKHQCLNKSRSKSKSPSKQYVEDNFDTRDFQYSWMPVPESDSNLAIHAIPNTVKQKSGNSVKFSTVDSYHEYRSRHKHTPPTKDTQDKQPKKIVEAVIIDKDASESSDSSSMTTSDTSSVQNMILDEELKSNTAKDINKNLSDAERIIIYKVLDSRNDKKSKKQTKLLNEIAKSLSCIEQGQKTASDNNSDLSKKRSIKSSSKSAENAVSFEQLNEGVYKMVEEQGDNITSMYFSEQEKVADAISEDKQQSCHCNATKEPPKDKNTPLHWESGDCLQPPRTIEVCHCGSVLKQKTKKTPSKKSSSAPSTSSFITASNAVGSSSERGGYIKLLDESGQEAGKFFIGATGLLKDNAYEVVLQLRKKEGAKDDKPASDKEELVQSNPSENVINGKKDGKEPSTSSETDTKTDTTDTDNVQQPSEDMREATEFKDVEKQDSKVITPKEIPNDVVKHNVSEEVMTDKLHHSRTTTVSSEDLCLIQTSSETKDKRDQSVHTGDHVHKSDRPARPATTTYTQTTLSSPAHRPVFFHMSSSTSTAYMSPPEMILPKYFRRNRRAPEDELYDVLYDPVETIEMTEKEYCEEYNGCTCTKCMHARKVTLKQNTHVPFRKRLYDLKKMRTPPNTARSPNDNRHIIYALPPKRVTTPCRTARLEKGKCKYSSGNGEPVKKQCRRSRRPSVETITTNRNINMHVGLNLKPRNKVKTSSSSHDKLGSSKLNPIIKDYINKLLALNRQGLKAVEVADQECSSVGTPGSSIINVPNNVDENKSLGNKISLEHIKNILKRQIIEKHLARNVIHTKSPLVNNSSSKNYKNTSQTRLSRKKPVHKVKSLNISKHLIKKNLLGDVTSRHPVSPSSTDDNFKPIRRPNVRPNRQTRSKSSPTPRQAHNPEPLSKFNGNCSNASTTKNSTGTEKTDDYTNRSAMTVRSVSPPPRKKGSDPKYAGNSTAKLRARATSPDTETTGDFRGYKHNTEIPVSMSTQTNQNTDSDSKFIKLAEDKLHNMEKIADLTEKCTKRLSNLAKVLEEVRKNKSLAYSQISSADSTDSQSDHKSDKATLDANNIPQRLEIKTPEHIVEKDHNIPKEKIQTEYMPVLTDVPKPVFKIPVDPEPRATSDVKPDSPLHLNVNTTELTVKPRQKPPPALSRIHLKHGQELVVPHELSTVLEVDSPMSTKHKNQSRNDANDAANNSNKSSPGDKLIKSDKRSESAAKKEQEPRINPDLLTSNPNFSTKFKLSSTESSDESKFQMIDLKQFNEIMLEPFISIQEYAKQYNMDPPDEGSNLEQREDIINDDMSSLHSDGSLPDVIAELLKRNIINEPFKYDTASNINSTTISSESTISMLALSKVRKDRKRPGIISYQNKESVAETSDTLSISSNPDLENAFKKLGMGWASSTLKKTKERLALSSSSNTSSSSIPHFKMKSFNQDIPALVSDSVSSALNSSNKGQSQIDASKNAEQQTTLSNSMTVKEFLRNELAKKITFNNKSNMNDTEEFVSLFETKMPEDMKENTQMNRDDRSMESAPSGTNRARTSTPVQIYRSMTYHSSSSSNVSNGLFSNADDLSSVKMTSNSIRNHSTSDKDDLTIPNFSLRLKKTSDCSKSD